MRVPGTYGIRQFGVEPGAKRQVENLAIVHVPEPPRQPVNEFHRVLRIGVAARIRNEFVELAVEPHEGDIVLRDRGLEHALGDLVKPAPVASARALRRQPCHQPLEFPAHDQQFELALHVDVRHHHAPPRDDHDEPLPREPLQCFPHRRAPDAERLDQNAFGQNLAGTQHERDDAFLDFTVSRLGQRDIAHLRSRPPATHFRHVLRPVHQCPVATASLMPTDGSRSRSRSTGSTVGTRRRACI